MSLDDAEYDERLGPILDELLVHSRAGEKPDLQDYQNRFPDLAEKIADLYETIFLIEANGSIHQENDRPTNSRGNQLERLGEYRIVREIGRGGMGIVYEAVQESLDRRVAIKVLPHSKVMSEDQVKRFQREAKAAGHLRHPNIVGVIDVGEENGLHFYVMQFIKGIPLDRLLKKIRSSKTSHSRIPNQLSSHQSQPQPYLTSEPSDQELQPGQSDQELQLGQSELEDSVWSSASSGSSQYDSSTRYFRSIAKLAKSTANALDFAHRNGVLHRDIKPANLLIDENDHIWITDFGLAKFGDDELTRTGDLVGTLRYMPPERLRGWSDPRSDVYSLGLTIYELVTLQPAFESDDRVETLKRIQSEEPIAPRKVDSNIPTDLETIILTSIAKEPNSRYSSASQMADDFERFLDGRPILARRSSVQKRMWLWCRRKPVVASLITLAVVLLLSIAIGSLIFALKLNEQVNEVVVANEHADARLVDAYIAQVEALRSSHSAGSRRQAIDAIKNAVSVDSGDNSKLYRLRNNAIAVLGMYDIEEIATWDRGALGCDWFHASFDRDVSRIAHINKEQYVEIFELETGLRRVLKDQPRISVEYSKLLLSPDGSRVAFGGHSIDSEEFVFRLIDLETGSILISETRDSGDFVQAIVCTENGSLIAYLESGNANQPPAVVICNLQNGELVKRIEEIKNFNSLSFSSDHKWLLANRGNIINVIDTEFWQTHFTIEPRQNAESASWGSGDRSIIVTSKRGVIEFWTFDGEKFLPSESSPKHVNVSKQMNVSSHPTFPVVVTSGMDGRSSVWSKSSGSQLLTTEQRYKHFSKDGERLGFSNRAGAFGVSRLVHPDAVKRLELADSDFIIGNLSFSKSEKRLSVQGLKSGRTSVFDTDTGGLLARQSKDIEFQAYQAFSPDNEFNMIVSKKGEDHASICLVELEPSKNLFSPYKFELVKKETLLELTESWLAGSIQFDSKNSMFSLLGKSEVQIRSWPDCRLQQTIQLDGENYKYVNVSPNGKLIAVSDYNSLRHFVYDLEAKKVVFNPTLAIDGKIRSVNNGSLPQFSKDGKLFVVSTSLAFFVYSTTDWELVKQISRRVPSVGYATFSDQYLAIADCDFVGLYRLDDFELLVELENSTVVRFSSVSPDEFPMLKFSPSGRFLAAGTMQSQVILWDMVKLRKELSDLGLDWE